LDIWRQFGVIPPLMVLLLFAASPTGVGWKVLGPIGGQKVEYCMFRGPV
jgi:hypothetical protein